MMAPRLTMVSKTIDTTMRGLNSDEVGIRFASRGNGPGRHTADQSDE